MFSVTHATRRLVLLSSVAVVLGLLGGAAAWVLIHLIGLLTNVTLFGRWAWTTPNFSALAGDPRVVVAAVAGALFVAVLARWSPVIRAREPESDRAPHRGGEAGLRGRRHRYRCAVRRRGPDHRDGRIAGLAAR